jgi:LDH2 family malate/lactate/ureidoglycolate dehydrogenase
MGEENGNEKIIAGYQRLNAFCAGVFEKLGVPHEDALIAADAIVGSNMRGVDTHGVIRMLVYTAKLKGGFINPKPNLRPLRETKGTALLDGGRSSGTGRWRLRSGKQKMSAFHVFRSVTATISAPAPTSP